LAAMRVSQSYFSITHLTSWAIIVYGNMDTNDVVYTVR
jgi:hypothetical protein